MKKTLTCLFLCGIVFASCPEANAQSFTVISDTIHISAVSGPKSYFDSIVTVSPLVTYSWKVIACNFPPDWDTSYAGFCDNNVCRYLDVLWPSGNQDTTFAYHVSDTGTLELALDLPIGTPSGCYYVTARLHNIALYSDSTTETWFVCYTATGVPTANNTSATSLAVFPNPTHGAFTLCISSPQKEEATIIITNVVGEKVKEFTATTNENMEVQSDAPAGVYFVMAVTKAGTLTQKIVVQ